MGSRLKRRPYDEVKAARDLVLAVREDNIKCIRRQVKRDRYQVNVVDPDEESCPTPLLLACQRQNYDIIRILLTASPPADINTADRLGIRPIWYCVVHSNTTLAELLIDESKQECDVNYTDKSTGCTPFFLAVLNQDTSLCRILIDAGCDVNMTRAFPCCPPESKETPLIKTVQFGNSELCRMIIRSGCDLNAQADSGFTALHYAVALRRYDFTETLLFHGMNSLVATDNGATAMTLAIDLHLPRMCKLLAEYGYDLNWKFSWNETPLDMAIRTHSNACALTLVHQGCSLQRRHPSYFRLAIREGMLQLARMLVEVNPLYFNENWITTKKLELSIYNKPDFCDWLFSGAVNPRPLLHLCRVIIRGFFTNGSYASFKRLPLPETLIAQLELRGYIPDNLYKTEDMPFQEERCPYNCLSYCDQPQCPVLDFPDSASDHSDQ